MSIEPPDLAATAASSRRTLKRVVVGGLLVALVALAGTLGLVGYAARAIDQTQAAREQALVAHSLSGVLVHMRQSVTSSALWDKAYSTMTPAVTDAWADPNFGSYYADYMELPVTVVFDSPGRYVFASRNSETVPLSQEIAFADAVAPLVAAVRAESARKRFGPAGVRNVSFAAIATRESVVSVKGELYLVSVSTIVAEHREVAEAFDGPDPIVAAGRPMSMFLKSLGDDLMIREPRMAGPHADGSGPQVTVTGVRGEPLGTIVWTPARPGRGLLDRAQPLIWGVVILLTGAAVMLLARVMTILRRLDENERNLTAARDAAHAASEAKSQFLANMSHELRTPLNGIVAVAEVLNKRITDPSDREMLGLITASSNVLEQVVNDILDTARIEAGRLTLEAAAFDLETCLRGVAGLHAASASAKGLNLDWRVSPKAAGTYIGDANRVSQILNNLLSNAVKFTAQGYVRVTVRTTPNGLRFAVRDSGMGFDAETRQRLFKRFEQADDSMTRRHGGTGLGLSISRSLANAMGGDIDVRSTPGKGSAFLVTLPLKRAVAVESLTQPAAAESTEAEERPLRVLLAEDHPTNQRVIALILEPLGVDLSIVEDGAAAVAATNREPFDLILMDVQMPVMDGLTATRTIRAAELSQGRVRTPIVSLTAHAMGDHVAASLAAGADRHMAKPVRPEILIQTVIDMVSGPEPAEQAA
jgi:signal transduction histidine kinase/CheY-like chemotaxis protein